MKVDYTRPTDAAAKTGLGGSGMPEEMNYLPSRGLLRDTQEIIESAQRAAFQAVDRILVLRNWLLGKRIADEVLIGTREERYGTGIISGLAEKLGQMYGKGFDKRALYRYVKFYRLYPEIVVTPSPQSHESGEKKIVAALSPQSVNEVFRKDVCRPLLSWSHYERLLQVGDSAARAWYEKEALAHSWSVRTLRRNVETQYYDRMLLSQDKLSVEAEMLEKASPYQHKYEFLRNPVIAEFLGMDRWICMSGCMMT